MTKDVRMIITIEIENSRGMTINVCFSNFHGNLKQIHKKTGAFLAPVWILVAGSRFERLTSGL